MKQEGVCDWMTREVITISPNTSLTEAHKLMMEKGMRRLPVIQIITESDIFRLVATEWSKEQE